MDPATPTPAHLSAEELAEHDRVVAALTGATRELAEAQALTEVDLDEAAAVTQEIEALTARLRASARGGPLGAELGPDGTTIRNHGNTVTGLRNPIAVFTAEHRRVDEEKHVHVDVDLGALYEGPPGLVHGGVSALLLDQLLGESAAVGGGPGMTARLTLHYRRPTPLGPLHLEGWLESSEGRKSVVRGEIRDPDGRVTVEAEGLFVLPSWAAEHPAWKGRQQSFE
ncbi:PaaI family thioesterase [Nocardioides sp. HDW12B]|uniref:PaaI family thioesterase n=1 Tax=Nocardioides sp. HDW12B TaxID=2714939 RepID=UPI0014084F93|nr:PaaI family thioesterase [Nocardioides sp. HDW12B]QIK68189.1 PaaI family thioesterase [Nocardioides sp. HDW12B]